MWVSFVSTVEPHIINCDLYWNDGAGLVLCRSIVFFAEAHDVDTLQESFLSTQILYQFIAASCSPIRGDAKASKPTKK